LKGGHALTTFLLMRELGLLDALLPELADVLRETDPEHPHGTGHLFWALLDVLDAERRRGRVYGDAVLFALFFLPIVRARVREAAPDVEPSPALLATLIEDLVTPLAVRMALPHAVSHRIKQALTIVGKLSHRPDSRLATPRLAFREAFPTALELFELRAMATGRGEELVRDWRALAARVEKTRQALGEAVPPPAAHRRRRRRGGRGRRAAPA
jgi:poly(A) polymerase